MDIQRMFKFRNLFVVTLLASFFLPWSGRLQGISDIPLTGFDYTLAMTFLLSPIVGLVLIVIPILCIIVLIQELRTKNSSRIRLATAILTIILFLIAITYHTVSGMHIGKTLTHSMIDQLSQIRYGVYLALLSSIFIILGSRVKKG
ncbi:hypothetical protein [Bacillus sp. FJAT-49736]|uniref:hypothetical protein n=1 Tax=Bacillus sp. FJAT-49736 TaxID=2833582 RepID=UPI001BC8EAEB|nr:hypothetical protein [Bacillus sp. FJAT-49736]MBS4174466.1 hypothetical protein [Bacillus sp. FJAT-49736]MBS4175823.1 hypothetical protein [Bacillus sp. FJAT-49736]